MDRFTTGDVLRITGCSQPKIQQWLRDGFIRPSMIGVGSGTRHYWTFRDVCAVVLFQKLTKSGFSRESAGKIAQEYRHRGDLITRVSSLSTILLDIDSKDIEAEVEEKIRQLR